MSKYYIIYKTTLKVTEKLHTLIAVIASVSLFVFFLRLGLECEFAPSDPNCTLRLQPTGKVMVPITTCKKPGE